MCKFEDARGGRDATCASNMDASSRLPEDDVRGHQRDRDEDGAKRHVALPSAESGQLTRQASINSTR